MTTEVSASFGQHPAEVQRPRRGVLVVDDDPDFRALARGILEPAGYEVSEAEDVAECLSHLRSHATALVVLDLVMPDRDGIEGLAEIKALSPGTRIVTVSGAGRSEEYLKISAFLGADATLDKCRIGCLCALLKVVLER